jgi:hypothetical protein
MVLLSACGRCPGDNCVIVPPRDDTSPTAASLEVRDGDTIRLTSASRPLTIIAVSDVVRVFGDARDEEGIKAVRLWGRYTYYNLGQPAGPAPTNTLIAETVSNAVVGGEALKFGLVANTFDLRRILGSWSRVKIDLWIEGENFHGGKIETPVATLSYPTRQDGDTDYMAFCRKNRVPIPPDWAEKGTEWVLQGNLNDRYGGTNLLVPGEDAFVWTWSDPVRKGAAIALPRGDGRPGSLAGIISQSAITGYACFWDNMPPNDQRRGILGWRGQTLRISQLADGSNLTGVTGICTECHRGNNVFIISPDDPTWAKVLRGPLVTTPGSTFTTRLESSTSDPESRYFPVTKSSTTASDRPGWANVYTPPPPPPSTCAACHENAEDFLTRGGGISAMPTMPPDCASAPEGCYGRP